MIWFEIVIAIFLLFTGVMWARAFMLDALATDDTVALIVGVFVGFGLAGMAFLSIEKGWVAYFIVVTILLGVAQFLYVEGWADWLFRALLLGCAASGIAAIFCDIRSGTWAWGNWFFNLLFWPIVLWLGYRAVTFFSKEEDARRAGRP